MQKKQECKKAENARSISKLMQKRGRNAKKGRKYTFNFEISTKKSKKKNRNAKKQKMHVRFQN